ncbi:MAG: c-type cytochrome [Chitinivorax sp.]
MSNNSKTSLVAVLGAIAIPVVSVYLVAQLWSSASTSSADLGSPAMSAEAVTARIQPVGLSKASVPVAPGARTGEQVFTAICVSCHGTGAAGAPKVGDNAAWAPRLSQGMATLLDHATKGFKAMPARGGSPDLTDDEVARAIAYMGNKSGGSLTEPKVAPAAGGAAKIDPATKGKEIYSSTCSACHATGAAGAPKFGDKAAWAPRIGKGMEALIASATKGLNAMPPKGGYSGADAEFAAAVEYMVSQSK